MGKLPTLPKEEAQNIILEEVKPEEINEIQLDTEEESDTDEVQQVINKVDQQDVFDDIDTLPLPTGKKKRVVTQAQKDHLAKIRVKALATRKSNAEAKRKSKANSTTTIKETPIQIAEVQLPPIQTPKPSKKDITSMKMYDEEFLQFVIGKTYDRVKADRKAKKEKQGYEEQVKTEAYARAREELKSQAPVRQKEPEYNMLMEGGRSGGLFKQYR
tara:strand:- start:1621 stop:2265 length:645 start_codon:yes stop_codon:yes gene_type:complete